MSHQEVRNQSLHNTLLKPAKKSQKMTKTTKKKMTSMSKRWRRRRMAIKLQGTNRIRARSLKRNRPIMILKMTHKTRKKKATTLSLKTRDTTTLCVSMATLTSSISTFSRRSSQQRSCTTSRPKHSSSSELNGPIRSLARAPPASGLATFSWALSRKRPMKILTIATWDLRALSEANVA